VSSTSGGAAAAFTMCSVRRALQAPTSMATGGA
jgi:hypothetical protein